jgi:hypothetical protein
MAYDDNRGALEPALQLAQAFRNYPSGTERA